MLAGRVLAKLQLAHCGVAKFKLWAMPNEMISSPPPPALQHDKVLLYNQLLSSLKNLLSLFNGLLGEVRDKHIDHSRPFWAKQT